MTVVELQLFKVLMPIVRVKSLINNTFVLLKFRSKFSKYIELPNEELQIIFQKKIIGQPCNIKDRLKFLYSE